jgi:hypothetical protein
LLVRSNERVSERKIDIKTNPLRAFLAITNTFDRAIGLAEDRTVRQFLL